MSRIYRFRVVNVFAESATSAIAAGCADQAADKRGQIVSYGLTGNPLAVIEDAEGLNNREMQQIALQFNLSESTFVLPSDVANAQVRIFTPTYEMPFAGHPTLGTAHVLRALGNGGDDLKLQMKAGVIPVSAGADPASRDIWTLTANAPRHRDYEFSRAQIADALGLSQLDIAADPLWMDTGVEQLVVALAGAEAVARASPRTDKFLVYCRNARSAQAYVFAPSAPTEVISRFFWQGHGGIAEDPGTGSACANLGGYFLSTNARLPLKMVVHQGAATGQPCLLHLDIDTEKRIRVGGRVVEMMRGELQLD